MQNNNSVAFAAGFLLGFVGVRLVIHATYLATIGALIVALVLT